jgi:hypothetical protein
LISAGFDTHAAVKTLTAAGLPEAQAEAITELFRTAGDADASVLATKADLAQLKADLQREIGDVRTEMHGIRAELLREIAEAKAGILKWLIGMIAGAVVIIVMTILGAMLALVRLLGH